MVEPTSEISEQLPKIDRSKTPEGTERRWATVPWAQERRAAVDDPVTRTDARHYDRNIENMIGTVKVPVGLAAPLRVHGRSAAGDYYVPLATTEAALVASYNRGARVITAAGGCTSIVLQEAVSRSPAFVFDDLVQATAFAAWATGRLADFQRQVAATTGHGRLTQLDISIEGNHVYVELEFTTGDAAGQNMVTFASEAICTFIDEESPVRPKQYFLDGNLSSDKKASARVLGAARGRRVSAEVVLPRSLVREALHTTPEHMEEFWRVGAIGSVLSGTIGVQAHFANALAALYIATGQDAACVAESAIGVTRFEVNGTGDLYASVTLPNVIVGTVGGGTGLPSQSACLDILRLRGPAKAAAFAEVCAGICLAGELSLSGAMCSNDFAGAHLALAREGAAHSGGCPA